MSIGFHKHKSFSKSNFHLSVDFSCVECFFENFFFYLKGRCVKGSPTTFDAKPASKATATSDEGDNCQLLMKINDFELSFCAALCDSSVRFSSE
jgi:hypothetical protein